MICSHRDSKRQHSLDLSKPNAVETTSQVNLFLLDSEDLREVPAEKNAQTFRFNQYRVLMQTDDTKCLCSLTLKGVCS